MDELPKTAAYNHSALVALEHADRNQLDRIWALTDAMRDELLLHLNFSQSINDDCMRLKLEAEAEVERLRDEKEYLIEWTVTQHDDDEAAIRTIIARRYADAHPDAKEGT